MRIVGGRVVPHRIPPRSRTAPSGRRRPSRRRARGRRRRRTPRSRTRPRPAASWPRGRRRRRRSSSGQAADEPALGVDAVAPVQRRRRWRAATRGRPSRRRPPDERRPSASSGASVRSAPPRAGERERRTTIGSPAMSSGTSSDALGVPDEDRREHVVGRRRRELPERSHDLAGARRGVDEEAPRDLRPDGHQVELERGHDPEVRYRRRARPRTGPGSRPRSPDQPAVGGHQLDRPQAVDRQAELALEPAHAAAQRQARDARVRDGAGGACEAVAPGRRRRARASRAPPFTRAVRATGIDGHAAHQRQVDDHAVVDRSTSPGRLWPPLRTASARSSSRANRSAATTSPRSSAAGSARAAGRSCRSIPARDAS